MTRLLPVLAAQALTDAATGDRGLLVAARRGRVLHALLDHGQALTPTGRVRRAARPLCGRTPRVWRPADVDGRPLCATCSRVLRGHLGPAALASAATWLRPEEVAHTITTAPDLSTLTAARALLIESGHTGKNVVVEGRPVRLTALIAQARHRLSNGSRMTERDHAWISQVKTAPATRYPRRVS